MYSRTIGFQKASCTTALINPLAQVRALTAGDETKEQTVLNVDTWTALDELNAKAREARELEKIYKKH